MFSAQKSIKLYTMTAIIIFLSFLTAVAIAFLYKRFRWKKNFNREALLLSDQALEESIWRLRGSGGAHPPDRSPSWICRNPGS